MKIRALFFVLALLISVNLWSQSIDSNSITVSVTRSQTIRAEQANFMLAVHSGLNSDLTAIVSALTSAGIQQVEFIGVYDDYTATALRDPGFVRGLNWQFTYTVPFSKLNDTLNSLVTSANKLSTANPRLSMTFGLSGSTVSDASVADVQRKLLPTLVADAKKQAGLLADAAGLALGTVLSVSDGGSGYVINVSGGFLGASTSPNYTVSSSITVKFAAGRQ